MLNEVTLIGRVGSVPEVKEITTGTVTNISIATNRDWKDRSDKWHNETEWHNVVIYGKLGGSSIDKLKVGSLVYVKGRIKTNKWKDQNDVTHKYVDIIADDFKLLDKMDRMSKMNKESPSNLTDSLPSYVQEQILRPADHEAFDDNDPF